MPLSFFTVGIFKCNLRIPLFYLCDVRVSIFHSYKQVTLLQNFSKYPRVKVFRMIQNFKTFLCRSSQIFLSTNFTDVFLFFLILDYLLVTLDFYFSYHFFELFVKTSPKSTNSRKVFGIAYLLPIPNNRFNTSNIFTSLEIQV